MSRPAWTLRLDRREMYLLGKGVLSVFVGYAYAVAHVPRATRNSLSTATTLVPLWIYGALWIAAGIYCIAAALIPRDVSGFRVCVIMPAAWGTAYFVCWLHGDPGRGWVLAGIFWSIAWATYCASGLIDPMPLLRRERR